MPNALAARIMLPTVIPPDEKCATERTSFMPALMPCAAKIIFRQAMPQSVVEAL